VLLIYNWWKKKRKKREAWQYNCVVSCDIDCNTKLKVKMGQLRELSQYKIFMKKILEKLLGLYQDFVKIL
jgi:hypothetical protein